MHALKSLPRSHLVVTVTTLAFDLANTKIQCSIDLFFFKTELPRHEESHTIPIYCWYRFYLLFHSFSYSRIQIWKNTHCRTFQHELNWPGSTSKLLSCDGFGDRYKTRLTFYLKNWHTGKQFQNGRQKPATRTGKKSGDQQTVQHGQIQNLCSKARSKTLQLGECPKSVYIDIYIYYF